jgi:lipoate-protein ligase A
MTEKTLWRVLPWRTDDAYTNMAIDKTIAESVAAGGSPTIRFYKWAGDGAVSLGKYQSITDINTAFCEQQNVQYVRRFTGGKAMYHSPTDLTYAIAAPLSIFPTRLLITSDISRWILRFLDELGVPSVQCAGISSVTSNGRKISGGVPHYEKKMAIMQHGSVFYGALDYAFSAQIYKKPEAVVRERTTSVVTELGYDVGDVQLRFQRAFLEKIPHDRGDLNEKEWQRVAILRQEYMSDEWMQEGRWELGICNTTWEDRSAFWKHVAEDLRNRLLNKEAK